MKSNVCIYPSLDWTYILHDQLNVQQAVFQIYTGRE